MKQLIILLILSQCYLSIGQQVQWSDQYDLNGYKEIVAVKDGDLFIKTWRRTKVFQTQRIYEITKWTSSKEPVASIEIDNLEESVYYDLGTIPAEEGLLHLYYQRTKNDQYYISGQLYSYNDLSKLDILDLATFDATGRRTQEIVSLSPNEVWQPIDYRLSRDRTKLLVMSREQMVGRDKLTLYQYKVFDLTGRVGSIQEGSFYTDDHSRRYDMTDVDLSNNGDINLLLKRYQDDVDREFIDRKPAYIYEAHHITGDSTEYIYDIQVKKEFIDDLKIGGEDGEVYIAGYLREKPGRKTHGLFYFALDPLGNVINEERIDYRPREIKEMQGKEKKELNENFRVMDVVVADELTYVIKQYVRENQNFNQRVGPTGQRFTPNNQIYTTDYDLEEVIIEAYNRSNGEYQWTAVNKRRQSERENEIQAHNKHTVHLDSDDLFLIYNETPDNLERLRKRDKLKRTAVNNNNTEPTVARITPSGRISYRSVANERRFMINNNSVMVTPSGLHILSNRNNYSRYKVGVADLSILE